MEKKNNTTSYTLYKDRDEEINVIPFTKRKNLELKFDENWKILIYQRELQHSSSS